MAATGELISMAEYLHTSYSPDCEFVDGEVLERNWGDGPHAALHTFFIGYFAEHAEEFGVRVYPSLRTRVSDSRIRVPDVLLQRRDDPFEDIVTVPPLLCIEVLSPEDRMIAMLEKIDDYLEMGVPVVWLIDPRRRRMFCGDKEGLHPVAELVVPGSDVRLASAEVFADFNAWVTGSRRSSAE